MQGAGPTEEPLTLTDAFHTDAVLGEPLRARPARWLRIGAIALGVVLLAWFPWLGPAWDAPHGS